MSWLTRLFASAPSPPPSPPVHFGDRVSITSGCYGGFYQGLRGVVIDVRERERRVEGTGYIYPVLQYCVRLEGVIEGPALWLDRDHMALWKDQAPGNII
jgi:hypothetical protein